MNLFSKIVAGVIALTIAFFVFSFGYYQITGHQLGDSTGERLAENKARSQQSRNIEQANNHQKAHSADIAYLDKLTKADRSDLWGKIDSFHDIDKFRALYSNMVMANDEIKSLVPDNDKQKELQSALLASYEKRIDCASEYDMAYGRTGEDRRASIFIAKSTQKEADDLYSKFQQLADNL